jgi:hypothetical protein
MPPPCIKRGDVVLLKLLPEKSLDYQEAHLDPSFFPHETLTGAEWAFPYRPAVVRKVISPPRDAHFFHLDVYPLARRSGLQGLSTRRSRSLRPLEVLVDSATGVRVPCDELFAYKPSLLLPYKIEYSQVLHPLHPYTYQ